MASELSANENEEYKHTLVILIVMGTAYLISAGIVPAVEAIRLAMMVDRGTKNALEAVKAEIEGLNQQLKTLSQVEHFVKYSKTQRRIAKLEKNKSSLDAEVSSARLGWLWSRILPFLPTAIAIIGLRLWYGGTTIFSFAPLETFRPVSFVLPVSGWMREGSMGVAVWAAICFRMLSFLGSALRGNMLSRSKKL
uniref:Tail-anchored protein insertion receptor WRB n=1 Tax=Lotharella oceanica TaxID=641309 RepID=A0A7S2TPI1_9EUKA